HFLGPPARVAEWQTRLTQNQLPARACGFDSRSGHHDGRHEWRPDRRLASANSRSAIRAITTLSAVSRQQIEEQLQKNSQQLESARADLEVTAKQLASFAEDAEELRVRAIVADDLRAEVEHREADRHRELFQRHHDKVQETIARLEAE